MRSTLRLDCNQCMRVEGALSSPLKDRESTPIGGSSELQKHHFEGLTPCADGLVAESHHRPAPQDAYSLDGVKLSATHQYIHLPVETWSSCRGYIGVQKISPTQLTVTFIAHKCAPAAKLLPWTDDLIVSRAMF